MFWFAAALLAKASGLVFGVLGLFVLEIERLARQGAFADPDTGRRWGGLRRAWAVLRPWRRDLAWVVVGGLARMLGYCGTDGLPERSFIAWAQERPDGPMRQASLWLAEHLRIFSNGGEGLVRQIKHNLHGHGMYLLGEDHPRGMWYYFPVLLT